MSLLDLAYIKASPTILGLEGQTTEWVTVEYSSPIPSNDDCVGVFSPGNFSSSICPEENRTVYPPLLCSAPIKFQFANYSNPKYKVNGKGFLRLQLINQRSDFSFALFSGGLSNNMCTSKEKQHYKGPLNGTIHMVAGGGAASLSTFTTLKTKWSIFKDYDYGFVKLTAFGTSNLLFEYKKSRDGKVYDSFTISRDYKDILT